MDGRPVQLRVAGQNVKVTSTADAEVLQRLADTVTAKVESISPRPSPPPQALLLAAIALAHDLEEERARRVAVERRARDMLRRVIVRLDDALDTIGD